MSERHTSDPTPALRLLWGERPEPRRGPRRGLDLDRIVAAAVELADEEGERGLSMRGVASRLGIGTASLYTYVPSRTELTALMLDAVIAESPLPEDLPGTWRERVEAWARHDWRMFRSRPWTLRLIERPLLGPSLLAWYESALRVLSENGLSPVENASVIESVDAYVQGVARLTADQEESHAGNAEPWAARHRAYIAERVDFSAHPLWTEAALSGAIAGPADHFESGLRFLLDGVEADVRRRAERRD
ncbi:TetR/AcrR family transcriptional regulator [Nocardiopsis composta]|uniref:AcrR family transcriptional regulator n=1 Tax=Nocardiopsis composta TaxID=157465 RepID=A0A7W8QHE8_9ACTN|nr:TetR/AcrR family transcriptional regulator [Nocardiopsis composta]MBB5430507.1 AcrR family transcriptional regulator [Nocardiopsis composta]